MGKKKGIPGLSFSWKRAVGLSQLQSKISRKSGIPLSRAGRQRKIGAATGCCFPALLLVGLAGAFGAFGIRTAMAQDAKCDWAVEKKADAMTDIDRCIINSPSAKIALAVDKQRVIFLTGSPYRNDSLQIRVDDSPALYLGDIHSTEAFKDRARVAVRQIMQGSRIRTRYSDYPVGKDGDAPICNLPQLIRDCGAPLDRIMDTRSQSEIIRDTLNKR